MKVLKEDKRKTATDAEKFKWTKDKSFQNRK